MSSDSESENDGNTTKRTKFIPSNRKHERGFRYYLLPLDITETIDITSENESGKKVDTATKLISAIKQIFTKFQIVL